MDKYFDRIFPVWEVNDMERQKLYILLMDIISDMTDEEIDRLIDFALSLLNQHNQ